MFILFEVDRVRQVVVMLIIISQQCSTSAMLVLVLLTEQTGEHEYIILLYHPILFTVIKYHQSSIDHHDFIHMIFSRESSSLSLNQSHYMTDLDLEGGLVREILYGTRHNVNFIHEVFRQAFLLSFSHSPAMKRVITVYKDWIQMNVQVRTCLISRLIILLHDENNLLYTP